MTSINITASLPTKIIRDLKDAGAEMLDDGDVPVIVLVESQKATEMYMAFLAGDVVGDPLLLPTFGNPVAPYQSANAQVEIHSMLATFQPLRTNDFGPAASPIPFASAPFVPPLGGYQYRDQIAIQKVQEEMENPSAHFAAHVPLLSQAVSGSVIADLQITYANCVVVRRLRKF